MGKAPDYITEKRESTLNASNGFYAFGELDLENQKKVFAWCRHWNCVECDTFTSFCEWVDDKYNEEQRNGA